MRLKFHWPVMWLGIQVGVGLSCVVVILGVLMGLPWWAMAWSFVLDVVGLSLGVIFAWSWMREQKVLPDWFGLFDIYGKYFFSVMMSWWFTLLLVCLGLLWMMGGLEIQDKVEVGELSGIVEEMSSAAVAFQWAVVLQFWILIRFLIMNLVGPVVYFMWLSRNRGKRVMSGRK